MKASKKLPYPLGKKKNVVMIGYVKKHNIGLSEIKPIGSIGELVSKLIKSKLR
jgi:hypothetical protein